MNKSELIKQVAKQSKLTQAECNKCLQAFKEVLTGSLRRGEMVKLVGFGRFYVRHYPKRQGYNPKTGKTCAISARYLPVFRASPALKGKF